MAAGGFDEHVGSRGANDPGTQVFSTESREARRENRAGAIHNDGLFLAVLLSMSFDRVFSVASSMNHVATSGVGMVCRLFMVSSLVMLGGFPMVTRGMRKVL